MQSILGLIGRKKALFDEDLKRFEKELVSEVSKSSFLVLGGAGSIGQAVTKEIFKRKPKKLHVVDISENNLAELVRDLRSTYGYIDGEFKTFVIDFGHASFEKLVSSEERYDFIFNLAALKHVRSERDPYTLSRMLQVNVFNTVGSLRLAEKINARKYFAVSSDKAANPANLMGASKRIMELFLFSEKTIDVSMARFANVAFSDGSLLSSFRNRIIKKQPLVAPIDIERYFITPEEAGILCLMSGLAGSNNEIFFPKDFEQLKLTKFSDILFKFLEEQKINPVICDTEEEARRLAASKSNDNMWPIYLFETDTTGEKPFEEFYTNEECLDLSRFTDIGVIKNNVITDHRKLNKFCEEFKRIQNKEIWTKNDYVEIIQVLLDEFKHSEKNKYLDDKM